jgi:hypothetical protein
MPYATLTFTAPINTSCQVGDIAYYVTVLDQDGFQTGFDDDGVSNGIVKIGDIREINNPTTTSPTMRVETTLAYSALGGGTPLTGKFIMFTKDNRANLSSPLGYYASVKMVNNSTTEAEMFSIGIEAYDSSK